MMWLLVVAAGGAIAMVAWRAHRARQPAFRHALNPDRCVGCDACVAVCLEQVLELQDNKCHVARPHACIGCEACALACPTDALAVHRPGREPPPIRVPDVDQNYQTQIPGQYLIGELAGKPLIKNAANLGRGVIEHMLDTGLRPGLLQSGYAEGSDACHVKCVDVVIIGAGPGGLSAALSCVQRGVSYALIEKQRTIAPEVAGYPRGKWVMAEPYEVPNRSLLPVFDAPASELLDCWFDLCEQVGLQASFGEAVESVKQWGDGTFDVATTLSRYRCQRVVVASGARGQPRRLGVPGENLPKVHSALDHPAPYAGQPVLVVGGGDSALAAALDLADVGARVVLCFRGSRFDHALQRLRDEVAAFVADQRIKLKLDTTVEEIDASSVTLSTPGGRKRYRNSAVFVLLGTDPIDGWLRTLGVELCERPHHHRQPDSDELCDYLLGEATPDCPTDPVAAARLVLGSSVEPRGITPSRPTPTEDTDQRRDRVRSRRARSTRLAHPVPLSEFVRRRGGDGHRDDLSPSERTRLLRALRDEGARRADQAVPTPAAVRATKRTNPVAAPMFLPATAPSQVADDAPTKALIVGLARARSAPAARRPTPVPHAAALPPRRPILPPPFPPGQAPPRQAGQALAQPSNRGVAAPPPRQKHPPKQGIARVSDPRLQSLSDVDWDLD